MLILVEVTIEDDAHETFGKHGDALLGFLGGVPVQDAVVSSVNIVRQFSTSSVGQYCIP